MMRGSHAQTIMIAKIISIWCVTAKSRSVGEKLVMTLTVQAFVARMTDFVRRGKEIAITMESAKDPLNVARTTALGHQAGQLTPTAAMIQEFAYIISTQVATKIAQVLILPEL